MSTLKDTVLKNQYFLRELAGSGGMADVYLAWDKLRSAKMAVKVLRRDLAENEKFYHAFEKEAHLLEELQHPFIVRLYEFGREKDMVFIVMAWVDGVDLKKHIASLNRPLSLAEISQIFQPLCSALHFAHQKQAYHCDIKPANILLHENGRDVFLADFGVARVAQEQAGGGTLPYMAPEQFLHEKVSAQTDIYALGITLYEMVCGGVLPYRGDTNSPGTTTRDRFAYEHSYLPMPSPMQFNPALSQSIVAVIQKALSKSPADRFRSALEFLNAFEQARISSKTPEMEYKTSFEPDLPPVKLPNASQFAPPKPYPQTPIRKEENISQSGNKLKGPHLFVRSGEMIGQAIPILSRTGMTIGRGTNCHVHLQERSVSRLHVTILITKKAAYVRDEASSLGTYVNGKRIPANIPVLIQQGDVIQIGHSQIFEFRRS
jgi:serine/threonine-protein kinase